MSGPTPPRPDLDEPPPAEVDVRAVSWKWWEVLLVGLLGVVLASFVVFPLFTAVEFDPTAPVDTSGQVLNALIYLIWVGVFVAWLSWLHRGWPRALGWPRASRVPREIAIGAGLGVLLYIGSSIVGVVLTSILRGVSDDPLDPPVQVETPENAIGVAVLIMLAVVVAAAAEEFIFRGLLFRSIADRYGFWPGAVLSAVAFGLVHDAVGSELAVWVLRLTLLSVGLGLAWIYARRRNLLAVISAHAAFNTVGVAAIVLLGG
jgi:membrane protease YdiL (CAAX protease family)